MLYKILLALTFLIYPLQSQTMWDDFPDLFQQAGSYKTGGMPHCGFHMLLEAYRLNQPQVLQKIHNYKLSMREKTYQSILSPSGHFLINYENSGSNAIPTYDRDQNGTPDYLEFVAKSFDRAWLVEIDSLGFKPPPEENGDPKETYEIFCKRLGLYGRTFFFLDEEISALPGNNYPSYIEISTEFPFVPLSRYGVTDSVVRDSMAIAVTAAHEFNHALQLGYNIWDADPNPNSFEALDLWYIENSATYMEEVVADQVNDYYQYLHDFFISADQGITYDPFSSNRIYGEVVFDIMAGKLYGRNITRRVWQEIVNRPALEALDKVFERKGSSLEREWQRLSEWMFFCGKYAMYASPGRYFVEGANYPYPESTVSDDYSSGLKKVFEDQLPPLSIQYVKTAISTNSNLNIYFSPEGIPEVWSGIFFSLQQPFGSGFPAKVYSQIAYSSIQSNNDSLFAAVISGNWNGGKTDSLIRYSLFLREFSGNPDEGILVYPSIVKPAQGIDYVTFKNVPADSRIEIFSSNGTHISTIRPQFFNNNNSIFWNLKTSQGDKVGSGVYVYSIISPTTSQKGKIIVIR